MSLRTPSINNVTVAGNIVKDAEIRRIGDNNTAVTRITIANNRHYKDKDNNWQDTVTFVDVELWGPIAERSEEFGKKGIPVIVEGSLKENRWKDKEDKNHSKLQIRAERIHVLNYPEKSK
jgi:single-strand DNA-binding protein